MTLFNLPHLFYVVLLVIVSFYIVYFIRHNYKVGVFFLTLMMVILLHISSMASWQLIGWRVLSTCIGSVLAVLAGYAFWPMWEKQQFPTLMSNALQQNKNYLKLIIAYLLNEQTDNDSWIKQRNKVEAANSDVFACVQRMNIEPQHIQQNIDKSFSLVGINIRIAREITSIALSLSSLKNENITSKGLPSYQQQLVEIIDILDDLIADKKIASLPDFKSLNTLSTQVRLEISSYHFIKTEFEKIIFELENMYMILDKNNQ